MRLEHKKILEKQLKLLGLLNKILDDLQTGTPLKPAYMKRYPEFEKDDDEFMLNRKLLNHYLGLLNASYT